MKQVLAIAMLLLSLGAFAQDNAVNQLFSDYEGDDRFTEISISGKMFQLLTHIEGETKEEEEMLKAISQLKGLKTVVCNECDDVAAMYKNALSRFHGKYDELMRVEDQDENLTFFILEKDGMVTELVLVAQDKNEFLIMSLTGDIDLNQIARIGRAVQIDGLDHLEKMEDQ